MTAEEIQKLKVDSYMCRYYRKRFPWAVMGAGFLGASFAAAWLHEWMLSAMALVLVIVQEIGWRIDRRSLRNEEVK